MVNYHKIAIIGVPQDLGASRRGVDMGPSAIRVAGLREMLEYQLGYEVIDYGNISCHDIDEHFDKKPYNNKLRYLDHIVSTSSKLKAIIEKSINLGHFPLVLGGDHSIAIGSIGGAKVKNKGKAGIFWVDAHGDYNTPETTKSGNIHGMPLAIVTNRGDERLTNIGPSPCVIEKNAVIIGARDIDNKEKDNLKDSKISVFTMSDIDMMGFANIAKKAIAIATKDVEYLHVSLDIDALDPIEAPGTGTSVQGGLTYREAHLLMELIHESGKLHSMDIVEINPTLDHKNKTAILAVGLIGSALGNKIM